MDVLPLEAVLITPPVGRVDVEGPGQFLHCVEVSVFGFHPLAATHLGLGGMAQQCATAFLTLANTDEQIGGFDTHVAFRLLVGERLLPAVVRASEKAPR